MDTKKQEIINLLIRNAKGKNLEQILPQLMSVSSYLSENGISFTKEETNELIQSITSTMKPEEKQRFEMLRNFIL